MQSDIRDKNSNVILKINSRTDGRNDVRTPSGEYLGSTHNGNTYDKNGNLVFHGEDPGLLRRK